MATNHQEKKLANIEKQAQHHHLNGAISKQVLLGLGQPQGLHLVQVRFLWEDHYRVNVFVGVDAASAKVAHSYFLVADSAGNILASTPKITSRY
jgi:hypothetical protein